jgi:hypothetical protein
VRKTEKTTCLKPERSSGIHFKNHLINNHALRDGNEDQQKKTNEMADLEKRKQNAVNIALSLLCLILECIPLAFVKFSSK